MIAKRAFQISGPARRRAGTSAAVALALAFAPLPALAQAAPAAAPNPSVPAAADATPETSVDFSAGEAGLSVLGRPITREGAESPPADDDFSPLCVAPCRARLPESSYQFAVRRADGPVLPSPLVYELSGPSRLHTEVISRESTRREGWYVLGIVGGAGAVSTTVALSITCGENRECAKWTSVAFWGGLGALSLGALIGLPKVATRDELSITVLPVAPAPAAAGRFAPVTDERGITPVGGLTVAGSL